MSEIPSPSQTIGPLYGFALMFTGSHHLVEPDSPGALRLEGVLYDGGGPLRYPDAMLEIWHGDLWARARTDENGAFRFVVRKPEATPLATGEPQAPHLNVAVFARGLLKQACTRMYFPDEEAANAADPVLQLVPPEGRHTLVARAEGGGLRFDIRLQGEEETVFFDVHGD